MVTEPEVSKSERENEGFKRKSQNFNEGRESWKQENRKKEEILRT